MKEEGGRETERARYDRLTVKKNAVCCRNGEKVPKRQLQTYMLLMLKRNRKDE